MEIKISFSELEMAGDITKLELIVTNFTDDDFSEIGQIHQMYKAMAVYLYFISWGSHPSKNTGIL